MDISRKTDYALRILAELMRHDNNNVLSVRTAAKKNDVPYSFARSIQHDLTLAGIITSTRGAQGGMKLTIDPKTTSLLTVVEACQGPVAISDCGWNGPDGTSCPRHLHCSFYSIWCGASRMLRDYLDSITLYEAVFATKAPSLPEGYWNADAFASVRGIRGMERNVEAAFEKRELEKAHAAEKTDEAASNE